MHSIRNIEMTPDLAGLSALVAEKIMGYKIYYPPTSFNSKSPEIPYYVPVDHCPQRHYREDGKSVIDIWHPAVSLDHCAEAEEKFKEMGLRHQYGKALMSITGAIDGPIVEYLTYILATATAEQRCEAMLAALEDEEEYDAVPE